jgi:hypothetical protein
MNIERLDAIYAYYKHVSIFGAVTVVVVGYGNIGVVMFAFVVFAFANDAANPVVVMLFTKASSTDICCFA